MSDSLSPLMFTVGLIDRITGPATTATRSFESLSDTAKTGFSEIAVGSAGMLGAGLAIKGI